jgi:hypothetical protein
MRLCDAICRVLSFALSVINIHTYSYRSLIHVLLNYSVIISLFKGKLNKRRGAGANLFIPRHQRALYCKSFFWCTIVARVAVAAAAAAVGSREHNE